MPTADRENILAVMKLLEAADEALAAEKLISRVFVHHDGSPSCQSLAVDVRALLNRSLHLTDEIPCDIEVAVGTRFVSNAPIRLHLAMNSDGLTISLGQDYGAVDEGVHGVFRRLAACYAAGNVIARAVGGAKFGHLTDRFEIKFSAFGVSAEDLRRPIDLHEAVLVGAGGIANGLMWAAAELDLRGTLTICDPKNISAGNLNRCLFFENDDVELSKADVLARRSSNARLNVAPFVGTFGDLRKARGRIARVFTTVDSRATRRAIQKELPIEVLDASTTDLTAVVVHSHRQPNEGACLCCIYPHIPVEDQRQKHVAEGLGITIEEARQAYIDEALAHKLASLYVGLSADYLRGKSLDTVYKEQCGQGVLFTAAGEQAIAPLAFISNLAGVLLAIELVRFEAHSGKPTSSGYMSLDPWRMPTLHARRPRARLLNCEFCGDLNSLDALAAVWPELPWDTQAVNLETVRVIASDAA